MTAATLPVGLPRPNPTKAYWQTPPHRIADYRSTPDLPKSSKYVIVGSGITGAITAWKILQEEPSASIVILEARQACSGATGRNGGHCRAGRYLEFKESLGNFGLDEALKMEALEETNVENVASFIKEHGIECDLRAVETVDIFTDLPQWEEALAALKARNEAFDKAGASTLIKHKVWSARETREILLVPAGLGAISFPAYVLSPYKFVCRLLEMCMEKGVNLQTNTPVVEVSQARSSNEWIVHTADRGEIFAEKAILATNAYTAALYPQLADYLIPTRGQVSALRPGLNIINNPALKRTVALNSAESGDYFQSRAEGFSGAGDLIVGGGRNFGTHREQPLLDDTTIHPDISKYQTHMAARYFGRENWGEDGEVLQEWTGIMGYTKDKQPIVGEAPGQEGLWVCVGFHGHGMAMTFQSAHALVEMMMGREKAVDEWLPQNFKLSRISTTTRK